MPDIASTLDSLNVLWATITTAEQQRRDLMRSPLPQAMRDEQDRAAQQNIAKLHKYQEELLDKLVHFPPHAIEHFSSLNQFHQTSPYDRSVFIMTKFPGNGSPLDTQLERVIKAVRDSVAKVGFNAHVASDHVYNPMLWKNVEFYLLACSRGIAIVESKHTAELNPNVTMEWGWMRGMDRQVLFLVEKSFDKSRADLTGLIEEPFDWDNPEPDVEKAVTKFLT